MKKELETKLVKAFPKIYRNYGGDPRKTCMTDFGCGDGWFKIILELSNQLSSLLDEPGFKKMRAEQVKEKFGGLRFYVKGITGEAWLKLMSLRYIQKAGDLSLVTCEECGKPGKRTTTDMGWIKVLCAKCKKEDKRVAKIKERGIV